MKKQIITFLFSFCFIFSISAQIVITEIMYNNPGVDDYEYIELYNNSMSAVDMDGWSMGGVTYTFSGFMLNAGEYAVLSKDAALVDAAFGTTSQQWASGSVNNSGETIYVYDAAGAVVDSVAYDDSAPWPTTPDGGGSSLALCDVSSDNNDAANWAAASTPTGVELSGVMIFANPGSASNCSEDPFLGFMTSSVTVGENAGTIAITLSLTNGNGQPTDVTVDVDASSTASTGVDFDFSAPQTITFPATNSTADETITLNIIEDSEQEGTETIVLVLSNPTNNATLLTTTHTVSISDNDSSADSDLLITGVFDAQPAASGTKGFELKAINNIPDLSIYGVESANNGGGASGPEFTFPVMSLNAGDCIYVADDATKFLDFFGFDADFVDGAANINGDDAIVLYKGGEIVDVHGDPNEDGTGTPWETMDGWGYRVDGTGPDGASFNIDNWFFSGINALDGAATNAEAMPPFPVCAYEYTTSPDLIANDDSAITNEGEAVSIFVLDNDNLPNGFNSVQLISDATFGAAVYDMGDNSFTYTPDDDFCGDTDSFMYEVCDDMLCDTATVSVTVNCPITYPPYDIAVVTTVDANGLPDSSNVTCQLQGIVYGVDIQGGADTGISFTLIDATGGIQVFDNDLSFGYDVVEGDEVIVQGSISQFNGLTEILPVSITHLSSGNSLITPAVVTALDESTEAELIRINGVSIVNPDDWTNAGFGFNVEITDGTNSYTMRIDNDVDIFGTSAPVGTFAVIGIGSQFDATQPYDDGYQIMPRYIPDLIVGFAANDDNVTTDMNTAVTFDPLENDNLPDGFDSFNITFAPANGSLDAVGSVITYTPDDDYCGDDSFTYEVCKNMDCDEATVHIVVECDSGVPKYDIAEVTMNDATGVSDSIGIFCQLQGIVHGVDLQGGADEGLAFALIDATGGITVFNDDFNFGYTVTEGDEVIVQGTIDQFRCLTEIIADTLWVVSTGNDLVTPQIVTSINETHESELIQIQKVSIVDPADWDPMGSGFNVSVTDGANVYDMRIDNDVDLFNMPAPTGSFHVRGIGGQFVFDNDCAGGGGYQIIPRYMQDIIPADATIDRSLSGKIKFYPNPVNSILHIDTEVALDEVIISNFLGQEMFRSTDTQLDVTNLPAGMYTITFVSDETFWATEFVKL